MSLKGWNEISQGSSFLHSYAGGRKGSLVLVPQTNQCFDLSLLCKNNKEYTQKQQEYMIFRPRAPEI